MIEFVIVDDKWFKWFWIDLEGDRVGPFDTKEAANSDAREHCWLSAKMQEMKFECFVSRYGVVALYAPILTSGNQRFIESTSWWLVPTLNCPW